MIEFTNALSLEYGCLLLWSVIVIWWTVVLNRSSMSIVGGVSMIFVT